MIFGFALIAFGYAIFYWGLHHMPWYVHSRYPLTCVLGMGTLFKNASLKFDQKPAPIQLVG